MKPRHKPRPDVIHREECVNDLGEWVCSRMTYDLEKFETWRKGYLRTCEGGRPDWYRERRFLIGRVEWEDLS